MGEAKEEKKLSYDDLKKIINELQHQNKYLIEQFQKTRNEELFKRIEFLFKVLENSDLFPEEFINSVVLEIQDIMTIKTEETEE